MPVLRDDNKIFALGTEGTKKIEPGEADWVRWTDRRRGAAREHPQFVCPMAKTGIEKFAQERGVREVDEKILDEAREFFGM